MKKYLVAVLIALILLGSSACESHQSTPEEPVTVTMFGYWHDRNGNFQPFFDAVKEKFPEINLEYEVYPVGEEAYMDELNRRFEHCSESDIFLSKNTSPLGSGRLLDLTNYDFVNRYSLSVMKDLTHKGGVYLLPGTADVLCYAYNADWFKTMNTTPPQTLDEMMNLLALASAHDYPPFIIPFAETPSQLIKVLAAGYLNTPDGQIWLKAYNKGESTMSENPHWQKIWQRVQQMTEAGYLDKKDLDFTELWRIAQMNHGFNFMGIVHSSFSNTLGQQSLTDYHFNYLPLLGETPNNATVFASPGFYIGLSHRLDEPENAKKKEAALKILDFISTEDGQKLVAAGSAITNSYIDDISLTPKDESVTEVLEAGRFMAEPVFERGMEDTLGKALHAMVTQGLSPDDAIKMCDEKNTSYQTEITSENTDEQTVLGRATDFFPFTYNHSRSQELAITNFVSDAMRESTGTDIALEYGTIVKSELFKGTITKADLKAILRNDLELYTLDVTGQQIHDLIAEGLSDIYSPLFIVPSGLCYEYSLPKNGEGQKLLKLTLSNGSPLDMDKTYTVTVSSALLSDTISSYTFHGLVAKKTDKTLMGALQDTIEKQKSISPKLDRRIVQK